MSNSYPEASGMTLDELIERLTALRNTIPGGTPVLCVDGDDGRSTYDLLRRMDGPRMRWCCAHSIDDRPALPHIDLSLDADYNDLPSEDVDGPYPCKFCDNDSDKHPAEGVYTVVIGRDL